MKFRPNAATPEESKAGFVIFAGSPHEFHHWHFRTSLKLEATDEDNMQKTACNIVETLRGDALSVAQAIGNEALLNPDGSGIRRLLTDMQQYILEYWEIKCICMKMFGRHFVKTGM